MSFTQTVRNEIKEKRMDKSRTFVRDCFINGGVISNPHRTYHLEFTLNEKNADKLIEILNSFELHPKKIARGGHFVVYLKEADEICEVLKIIRADKSLLALEEMRVEKAIANNINRKVNFETANLTKTVDAAQSQIEAIKYIEKTAGLSVLSTPLEKVARLRIENETLSMAEIGALLEPPISKSGVNHRLRKLCKIAENMKAAGEING